MTRRVALPGRRAFILMAMFGATALRAQPSRPPVSIGFLRIVAPPDVYIEALEQGLRDRGYVPGRDVVIEYRYGDGRQERLDELARELVEQKAAILIVAGHQAVRAARKASRTLPIVMAVVNDPVAGGFIVSLARPGGNITGTTILSSTLVGKRLELMRQVLPLASRVGMLMIKDNPGHALEWKAALAAATALRMTLVRYEVTGPDGFEEAFAAMAKGGMDALVLSEDAVFATERARLVALAEKSRLPAVYGQRNSVDDGGLMSYGPSIAEAYRNAGTYVDKILRGARPADLPVEQPTKFELVVNLQTARALGLRIPQALLLRADEVIS